MFFICLAYDNLVRVVILQGEYAQARSLAEESLALSRPIDDRRNMVTSLSHLALLAFSEGEQTDIRWGLYCLGWVAFARRDSTAARLMYEKLLSILRRLDDRELLRKVLQRSHQHPTLLD